MNTFTIEYNPKAADGAVWTVLSPEGTSVFRTESEHEAITYRDERNERAGLTEPEVTA